MKHTMYLHGSKESNHEEGEGIGLTGMALDNFRYALYEVKFEVEINEQNGDVEILKVNDRVLLSSQPQTRRRGE